MGIMLGRNVIVKCGKNFLNTM